MVKALNFASKEKYRKFLAYGHMHKKFHGCQPVTIAGRAHKVAHEPGACQRG